MPSASRIALLTFALTAALGFGAEPAVPKAPAGSPAPVAAKTAATPRGFNAGLGEVPETVDRSSPLESAHGFLNAAHGGDDLEAAQYLDLEKIPVAQQATRGAQLARRLKYVLDRATVVDLSTLSREPEGDKNAAHGELVAVIPVDHVKQPLRLVRMEVAPGEQGWVFSRDSVKSIDKLFSLYGPPLAESLPASFYKHDFLQLELWQWCGLAACVAVAAVGSWLLAFLASLLMKRIGSIAHRPALSAFSQSARKSFAAMVGAGVVLAGVHWLYLTPTATTLFDLISRSVLIAAAAALLLQCLNLVVELLLAAASEHNSGPGRLRGLRTQLSVLHRIASILIIVVASALLLVQVPQVRHIGISMLASAGVAGLVVGLAAQKSIATLLAGIQLTVTQPIRIGDTVVVEGESGTVEELTLTFVTVKLWDLRRLMLPMTYFLEKPFQNWSRGEAELSASVTLRAVTGADTDGLRAELKRLLDGEAKELWDGHLPNVLVNESAGGLVIRVLAGAKNVNATWALQQLLTQHLTDFLSQQGKARAPEPGDHAPPPKHDDTKAENHDAAAAPH